MNQFQIGEREQAGTAFANLADQYSGHRTGELSLYFLGEVRMAQYRYQEAIEAYGRYIAAAGTKGDFSNAALIARAFCHEGLEQFGEAAEMLDSLSKTMDAEDTRYYEVLFYAATFYREANNHSTALEFYRQVSDNATDSIKDRAAAWVALLE